METRVLKAIARTAMITMIWSFVLAVIASGLSYVISLRFSAVDNWTDYEFIAMVAAFYVALVSGLVAFTGYLYIRTKVSGLMHILNAASWVLMLTLVGLIFWNPFVVLIAFVSSAITFTAYELSKRVRFVRKKQAKSPRLARL